MLSTGALLEVEGERATRMVSDAISDNPSLWRWWLGVSIVTRAKVEDDVASLLTDEDAALDDRLFGGGWSGLLWRRLGDWWRLRLPSANLKDDVALLSPYENTTLHYCGVGGGGGGRIDFGLFMGRDVWLEINLVFWWLFCQRAIASDGGSMIGF